MDVNNDDGSRSPRARLARRVKRLRLRSGLSLRQLSEKVTGYSHSYLLRVEQGEAVSDALIQALDDFFEADGVLVELQEMAQDSLIADYSRAFIKKEVEAERIQVFTSSLVPGLLQTAEYARELFKAGLPGLNDAELDERVAFRMKRKGILVRDNPPFYWAIMDEAALKRAIGGKEVMKKQLEQLAQSFKNPHVTVQVLPFEQGAHSMLGGGLTLLTSRTAGLLAYVESFANGEESEAPKRLVELTHLFDLARAKAMPEEESLELINKYLKEYAHDS